MDFYNKFDDKYEINVYLRTAIIVVLFFYVLTIVYSFNVIIRK